MAFAERSSVVAFLVFLAGCCTGSLLVSAYNAIDDVGNTFAPDSDSSSERRLYRIPQGFGIGAGSSAYQTEGAWNVDGKGESILDYAFNRNPNSDNGNVACDSYHKYKQDVQLAKNMQLDFYRFSLSWSRLLPNGTVDYINSAGVSFYNNLIDEMVNQGITPVVTIYHYDLPLALEAAGGWDGDSIQDHFLDYAKFVFKTFGDRVKWWITMNEPHKFCLVTNPASYTCAHNTILAHAKAYREYYNNYSQQGGQVGITLDLTYYTPLNASSPQDIEAAERAMVFEYASIADPILFGRYPEVMRETIDANSRAEGRNESRLPSFTDDEREMLVYAADFLGLNHYVSPTATPGVPEGAADPSVQRDTAVITFQPSDWKFPNSTSTMTPWGLRGCINWIEERYGFPTLVTENGYNGHAEEGLNDYNRISFHSSYLRAALRSVNEDGCNVLGYTIWSLMDSFEFGSGYGSKYGLSYVDFNDPNRERALKKSAHFLRQVMTTDRVLYYPFRSDE